MSELWVERHRPRTVADIKGQRQVVDRLRAYSQKRTFPHLMFAGPPGTGKTTAAIALARDVFGDDFRRNLLEMNASDERKLESIRTKVKQFARTAPVLELCHHAVQPWDYDCKQTSIAFGSTPLVRQHLGDEEA